MPLTEFDHAEKGDALYGEFHDAKYIFMILLYFAEISFDIQDV